MPEIEDTKRDDKGRFIPRTEQEIADDAVRAIEANPSLLRSILEQVKRSPVLNRMAQQNTDAALTAAKTRAGDIILSRVRENIFRPLLPDEYKGVLDHKLAKSAIDFGMGNLMVFLAEVGKDKLPEKMRPYAGYLGEATLLSAYRTTLGAVDVEGFIQKILSGDIITMLDGAFNPDNK